MSPKKSLGLCNTLETCEDVCQEKCEKILLDCLTSCSDEDQICISNCFRDDADCSYGKFSFSLTDAS